MGLIMFILQNLFIAYLFLLVYFMYYGLTKEGTKITKNNNTDKSDDGNFFYAAMWQDFYND